MPFMRVRLYNLLYKNYKNNLRMELSCLNLRTLICKIVPMHAITLQSIGYALRATLDAHVEFTKIYATPARVTANQSVSGTFLGGIPRTTSRYMLGDRMSLK